MGKMESAGEILDRINLQQTAGNPPRMNSSETWRREEIEVQIRRMYTSARQPAPLKGSSSLRLEVEDAVKLWKDIPTDRLSEAVDAAIVEAGNFLATNGLVAKLWAGRKPKEAVADFHNIKGQVTGLGLALPPPDSREKLGEMAREIQKMLGPGVRPKGWAP